MSIDPKKFFFSFFFFIGTLFLLGYYYYSKEQQKIIQTFDTTLQNSAKAAEVIIGDNYHDALSPLNPSAEDYAQLTQILTQFSNSLDVSSVYSMYKDTQGVVRYSGSSLGPTHSNDAKKTIHFNDVSPKNSALESALNTNTTQYFSNDTTLYRTIYIPHMSPNGVQYIIGVDIDISSINKLSNATAFNSIGSSLLIFLGIMPLFLVYRHVLNNTNQILEEKVEYATEKLQYINEKLEEKVEEKTREVISNLYKDTLTSLPNRLQLQEDLSLEDEYSVAILNVDDFKEINDFFGIDAGDDILNQVAIALNSMNINPYRIGGDEFAIVFPSQFVRARIHQSIETILHHFSERSFFISDEVFHLHATIGVAILSSKPLIHADIALNKARAIKKPYYVYDSDEGIEDQYKINIMMSAQIREALNEHRLICQYQPIVNCKTGIVEKYETLVRIQRNDGSLIPPNDFLPIAQKSKLYPKITQEVVYQSCNTFAHRKEFFSINLSITDILDLYTVDYIERILKQTGTASRIVFEILESEGIENYNEVISFIARMKKLGASIAIDDFGSGYSNFENILKLNIDFLKIDGSLIRTIDTNTRHRIVVESIIDFAHRIGIETIAEFVSSEEILTIITDLGITYAQGYHTGKPQFLN